MDERRMKNSTQTQQQLYEWKFIHRMQIHTHRRMNCTMYTQNDRERGKERENERAMIVCELSTSRRYDNKQQWSHSAFNIVNKHDTNFSTVSHSALGANTTHIKCYVCGARDISYYILILCEGCKATHNITTTSTTTTTTVVVIDNLPSPDTYKNIDTQVDVWWTARLFVRLPSPDVWTILP